MATVGLLLLYGLALCLGKAPSDMPSDPGPARPDFQDTIVPAVGPGGEPRLAVGPDGTVWLAASSADGLTVLSSNDDGLTWVRTPAIPPGQSLPTIDVDVAVTRTGRVLVTELDAQGLRTPVWYSDDRGASWTRSSGPDVTDQDRQFLAVGPDDPTTGQPRVFFAYHNFASGMAFHNLFVLVSKDGGATFGPPVPVALPGSPEWADMQCGNGGWPHTINVHPRSGRIFIPYVTRSSAVGGCGAQPVQANIIAGTRVWVATSADGAPGSWSSSLAVDQAASGRIVAAQFVSSALDDAGRFYVAYAETPRPYPDYAGASIRFRSADAILASWSAPVVVAPEQEPGHFAPHMVAGEAGRLAIFYLTGSRNATGGAEWRQTAAFVDEADSVSPKLSSRPLLDVIAYKGEPSALMGACAGDGPTAGIEGGFTCGRIPDVWGMARLGCRAALAWPTSSRTEGGRGLHVSVTAEGVLCETPEA